MSVIYSCEVDGDGVCVHVDDLVLKHSWAGFKQAIYDEAITLDKLNTSLLEHVEQIKAQRKRKDSDDHMAGTLIHQHYPMLSTISVKCPACDPAVARPGWLLDEVVVHLNDDHHWPREKIADLLEQVGL